MGSGVSVRRAMAALAVAFLAILAAPMGAPGAIRGAEIGAVADDVDENTGEGEVRCPGKQRALGGGIAQIGSPDDIVLRTLNPLDGSSDPFSSDTGDPARGYFGRASVFPATSTSFRTYVVCAKTATKLVAKDFVFESFGSRRVSARCPKGSRVVGGGAYMDAGFIRESAPADASGRFSATRTGDVAQRWVATVANQGGAGWQSRVWAVCSKSSKAKLKVKSFDVPPVEGSSTAEDIARCGKGKRAIAGGVLHRSELTDDMAATSTAPAVANGGLLLTDEGDVPKLWYAGMTSFSGFGGDAKVIAVCE